MLGSQYDPVPAFQATGPTVVVAVPCAGTSTCVGVMEGYFQPSSFHELSRPESLTFCGVEVAFATVTS